MMSSLGRNTVSGEMLESFVVRTESIRAEKKQLGDDEAAIMAEAKALGFTPAIIKMVVRRRAMKPHVWQETEALLDMYLHALGHSSEPSLFRQVGRLDVDITARESVIAAMKEFCPVNGSVTVEVGGKAVKLTRDKDGTVTATDVVERPPMAEPRSAPSAAPAGMKSAPPPDVDADGAEALGREAFKANQPIITNPFPFGDARRPRWDEGWRRESGSDGMGKEP